MVLATYSDAESWRVASLLVSFASWVFNNVSTCSGDCASAQIATGCMRLLTEPLFEQLHVTTFGPAFLPHLIVGAIVGQAFAG